jgi:hypothetical protein
MKNGLGTGSGASPAGRDRGAEPVKDTALPTTMILGAAGLRRRSTDSQRSGGLPGLGGSGAQCGGPLAHERCGRGCSSWSSSDHCVAGHTHRLGPCKDASAKLAIDEYFPDREMEALLRYPAVWECVGGIAHKEGISRVAALRGLIIALLRSPRPSVEVPPRADTDVR